MKISEAIERLKALMQEHGDCEIYVRDTFDEEFNELDDFEFYKDYIVCYGM